MYSSTTLYIKEHSTCTTYFFYLLIGEKKQLLEKLVDLKKIHFSIVC